MLIKEDIGKIPRHLCEQRKLNIIKAEVCIDHIHILVEILVTITNKKKVIAASMATRQ